ncbi:MAG: hypothetical protein IPL53_13080 [Ignavibacteria bacterium]|nr:hypothetical protein [Ignavibacteria bacterium]
MKTQKILLLTFAIFTLSSCGTKSDKQTDPGLQNSREMKLTDLTQPSGEVSKVSVVNQNLSNLSTPILNDRMIIRRGSMNLKLKNLMSVKKLSWTKPEDKTDTSQTQILQ